MEKTLKFLCFLLLLSCFMGCAEKNGYLSKDRAFLEPKDGISVQHPVEIEKAGIKAFTIFAVPMNSDLWAEVVDGGGVWPIEGYAEGEAKARGYCYLDRLNWIGEFLIQCVMAKPKAELEKLKFMIFNRDANWAYRLDGQEAREREVLSEQEIKDGQKPLLYDAEKFDKDALYKKQFVEKFGQTLSETISASEIVVGSPEWEQYCNDVNKRFPEKYKMANGEIRIGSLSLDEFRWNAVAEPGFDGVSRFVDNLSLPLYIAAFVPVAYPIILGAGLVNTAVAAGVDTSWSGFFARAKIIRYQMSPTFRSIIAQYQELIKLHLKRARELENQLHEQANLSKSYFLLTR